MRQSDHPMNRRQTDPALDPEQQAKAEMHRQSNGQRDRNGLRDVVMKQVWVVKEFDSWDGTFFGVTVFDSEPAAKRYARHVDERPDYEAHIEFMEVHDRWL